MKYYFVTIKYHCPKQRRIKFIKLSSNSLEHAIGAALMHDHIHISNVEEIYVEDTRYNRDFYIPVDMVERFINEKVG